MAQGLKPLKRFQKASPRFTLLKQGANKSLIRPIRTPRPGVAAVNLNK